MTLSVVDLFSGAGGWGVALAGLGVTTLGVDTDRDAVATACAAGQHSQVGDVRNLSGACADGVGLVASPPCQTWSQAGSQSAVYMRPRVAHAVSLVARGETVTGALTIARASHADKRTALVLEPMRVIYGSLPTWVAMEQVPGVMPVWEAYAHEMRLLGYSVACGVLRAEQYGVPQTRRRAVLVASREREVALPRPTHSRYYPRDSARLDPGVLPWVSMAQALGHEPEAAVPGDTSWTTRRPSPTIVASFAPDVVAAPGWRGPGDPPRQRTPGSVRVTVEEAGVLQGFPVDYPWQGSTTSRYRQVGNAIPPPLAMAALAEVI